MIPYSGVATVGERARAPVAYPGHVVRIPAEYSSFDSTNFVRKSVKISHYETKIHEQSKESSLLGHETAVIMPDNLPNDLIVLHFSEPNR